MKRKRMVIYDQEADYTSRFAEYASHRREPFFSVHGFTDCDKLCKFVQENPVDVLLIPPDYLQDVTEKGDFGQVILLSDNEYLSGETEYPAVYKFQSCEKILRKVLDVYAEQAPALMGKALRLEHMRLIGVYSPIGRTGKTSFALALGKELAKQKKTLYLNMEEYSGFPVLYPNGDGWTLSELLYFLKQGKQTFACKLEGMIRQMGSLDYIPPLKSSIELHQVTLEDWECLLETLGRETNYEFVILDLDGVVNGLFELMDRCEKIYMPVSEDETAQAKLLQYEEILTLLDLEELKKKTIKIQLFRGQNLETIARTEGRAWGEE
ncbi:MAG: hypothetical protein HFJ10_06115 [Lachnospiraceae bacterium]|jgi:hypothetical protein|nr:hypothetical protein [Lachnospiraceae bacterium]